MKNMGYGMTTISTRVLIWSFMGFFSFFNVCSLFLLRLKTMLDDALFTMGILPLLVAYGRGSLTCRLTWSLDHNLLRLSLGLLIRIQPVLFSLLNLFMGFQEYAKETRYVWSLPLSSCTFASFQESLNLNRTDLSGFDRSWLQELTAWLKDVLHVQLWKP